MPRSYSSVSTEVVQYHLLENRSPLKARRALALGDGEEPPSPGEGAGGRAGRALHARAVLVCVRRTRLHVRPRRRRLEAGGRHAQPGAARAVALARYARRLLRPEQAAVGVRNIARFVEHFYLPGFPVT